MEESSADKGVIIWAPPYSTPSSLSLPHGALVPHPSWPGLAPHPGLSLQPWSRVKIPLRGPGRLKGPRRGIQATMEGGGQQRAAPWSSQGALVTPPSHAID